MDKKEKYIAKTKGGTDTTSTKETKKLLAILGEGMGRAINRSTYGELMKNIKLKGNISDAEMKMLKKGLSTKKDGGMVKGYKNGGPAIVLGGIGKKIEDSIKTIDLDTAPKKVLGGLAGRLAKRGYGKARK